MLAAQRPLCPQTGRETKNVTNTCCLLKGGIPVFYPEGWECMLLMTTGHLSVESDLMQSP